MSDAIIDFRKFVLEGTRQVVPAVGNFILFCSSVAMVVIFFFLLVFSVLMLMAAAHYAALELIKMSVNMFRRVYSFFEPRSEEDQKLFEEALDRAMEQSTLAAAMDRDAIAKLKKKDEEALFQIGIEGPQKVRRSRSKRRAAKK